MTASAAPPKASTNGKHPPFNVAGIPAELKAMPQWVLWNYAGRGKKRTKVPYQPNGTKASSTDPATWSAFQRVSQFSARFDGIGIIIANGLFGFDLDHKIDASGQLEPRSQDFISRLNTYTERSPSGTGLHCLGFGALPGDALKKDDFEFYDCDRYFTMTGDHWAGTPTTVEHRESEIAEIYEEIAIIPNPFASLVSPVSDLAGRTPTPADWVIKDVIESGELALINGAPGSMKSLFVLCLCGAIAAGKNAITRPDGTGGLATKQTGVFWLNSDNSPRTHDERLFAMSSALGTFDIPFYSLTTTDFELSRADHVEWLTDCVADCGAQVVVIDTLSGVLPGIEENSAQEMTTPAANLRALANVGLTVIVLHHPPKNDVNGSRGSSVLEGKVDRRFTLARDGDLLTLKSPKTRSRAKPPIVALAALEIDPLTEALTGLAMFDGRAARASKETQEAEQAIIDALDAGPLNTRALYKAAKLRKDVVGQALANLLLARLVTKSKGAKGAIMYEKP